VIVGFVALVVANGAALLGAWAILERFRTGNGTLDLLVLLLLRLAILSAAVLIAGVAGALSALPLGLAAAAALLGLAWAGVHRRALSAIRSAPVDRILLGGAAILLARLLLQVWFFSPHLGDATAYHLPKIGEWIRAGGFTREMGLHPHVTFPAGFELVETWWTVFLRHDLLIEMAGVEFVALGAVAVHALARSVGLEGPGAAVAAFAFALSPGFHLGATSGLNDTAAAALVVAAMALAAGRSPMPLLVLTAGIGVGIKPTFGFALTGIALLWGLLRKEGMAGPRTGRIAGPILIAIGLGLGLFWYGRNLVWFGNPFYPLGSAEVYNPVAVQLGASLGSFGRNLTDLAVRMGDGRAAYGANVDEIAGWGPAAVALGLPGLLAAAVSDARIRRLAFAFALSLLTSLLFVQNDPWCLKYVFYAPAVLAIGAGWLWDRCLPARFATVLALGFSFLSTFLPYDLPIGDAGRLAAQPWRTRTALLLREPAIQADRVGCLGGYLAESYLLYGPAFEREVVYLRPTSEDDLLAALARHGLRALYAAPVRPEERSLIDGCVTKGGLKPLGRYLYSVVRN
jgi:hypothetical protein